MMFHFLFRFHQNYRTSADVYIINPHHIYVTTPTRILYEVAVC